MKRGLILIMAFTVQICAAKGQPPDRGKPLDLTILSRATQGNSYITFPTDIGNLEPLWFEANIIPNFNIRKSRNSRLLGGTYSTNYPAYVSGGVVPGAYAKLYAPHNCILPAH